MTARPAHGDDSLRAWTERALAGDTRALSRILSLVESQVESLAPVLDSIYRMTGRAHVIGITGVPGAGKSTLVARLAAHYRASGRRVAIVAVDPSSSLTGGAILGDRVRMGELAGDPGVYIRSMASRGSRGGLAPATPEAIDVLDAAGFEVIMVESVGVGQGEFEISDMVDSMVLVSSPGLGDDVQAIKAGILEMADIHVVNKADRPDAQRALADLQGMLAMAGSRRRKAHPPALATCGVSGAGVAELVAAIDEHGRELAAGDEGGARHRHKCERRVLRAARDMAAQRLAARLREQDARLLRQVYDREVSPRSAASALMESLPWT